MTKHRETFAEEIREQTRAIFNRKENPVPAQPQIDRKQNMPSKSFEPSTTFFKVFSDTVSEKSRPSVNIDLKNNPRLAHSSDKKPQQNASEKTADIAQTQPQDSGKESPAKFEPSANFHKIFSGIIGKDKSSTSISLKDNPRLTHSSSKQQE